MYVMGGITHVPRHLCGRLACGEGYSLFLNDVWRSQTGRDWVQLTSMAPWRARSDFGMVVANGLLWLVGGRGGDIMDAEENPFFNDMWTSRDGVNWHLNTTSAPWSPRCCMNVEYYQQRLMVMGGQVKIPPSPPPPVPPADTQAKLAAAQVSLCIPSLSLSVLTAIASCFPGAHWAGSIVPQCLQRNRSGRRHRRRDGPNAVPHCYGRFRPHVG